MKSSSRRIWRILGIIIGVFVVVFLGIQLLPVGGWQTNPPVLAEPNWPDSDSRALAQRACFDCHSNETIWPWYAHVAPVSWLVTRDVVEGRQKLNLSEWGQVRDPEKLSRELTKVLTQNEMPPSYYVLVHPEARLTEMERQQLLDALLSLVK
jgi:heme-binding protein